MARPAARARTQTSALGNSGDARPVTGRFSRQLASQRPSRDGRDGRECRACRACRACRWGTHRACSWCAHGSGGRGTRRGFTLIELLVVLVLIGIAVGVASLALRDPAASRLDRESARLVALLEAGRAEARASGLAVRFELAPAGGPVAFRFIGLPPRIEPPQRWLTEGVQAQIVGARAVVLGPEPLIGAQRIELQLDDQHLSLATDGLAPFQVVALAAGKP